MSHVEEPDPIPKTENSEVESFSDSSAEPDDPNFIHEEVTQVQKRKGGRKPIYATSEERKQRNRQAQAAFRERRTEYIKQLEATIKHHEETLQSLQQSHRSAADECLMLRYKNSLLERILLEKGIDVQAELKSKTEASHLPPNHGVPPAMNHPPPTHRAIINRHSQARRSVSSIASKPAFAQPSPTSAITKQSPRLQPTPPSQAMSPTATKSPAGLIQGGMTSPGVDLQAQRQQQPPRRVQQPPPQRPSISTSVTGLQVQHQVSVSRSGPTNNEMASSTSSQTSYYPSPFQTHYEQLGKLTPSIPFPFFPIELCSS